MGTILAPRDAELYQRVDEVLHYVWDPIGVADCAWARDEYHSYLPTVFSMLMVGENNDEKMAEYLVNVATDRMGLHETNERALKIVSILQDWKEAIHEKY